MKRVRAGLSAVEVDVQRLRLDSRPLSAKVAAEAQRLANTWMEQDARAAILREAPQEARAALMHEYNVTFFIVGAEYPPPFFTHPAGGQS